MCARVRVCAWVPPLTELTGGRGYYLELRHAVHASGWDLHRGKMMLKLCILPPAGQNHSLPSDLMGGGNYHWEDIDSGVRAANSIADGAGAISDFTCAPGWMSGKGENGPHPPNATRIAEDSPGWRGSHAIMPVPYGLFRTNYTPSPLEKAWAAQPSNLVLQNVDGVGGHGGTCAPKAPRALPIPCARSTYPRGDGCTVPLYHDPTPPPQPHPPLVTPLPLRSTLSSCRALEWCRSTGTCPDGEVYQVGDNHDSCSSLACIGGVSGTCSSNNPGGSKVMVICSSGNVREANADGVGNHGGTVRHKHGTAEHQETVAP